MSSGVAEKLRRYASIGPPERIETIEMVQVGGRSLFSLTIGPDSTTRSTAIVLCPSLFEAAALQRLEVSFMRRAAELGFVTTYLQPPGIADSYGDLTEANFEARVETALAGFDNVKRSNPKVRSVCFLGTRLGAPVSVVAGRTAQDATGVIVWDPSLDSERYWKQALRLHRIAAVSRRTSTWRDPMEEISEKGWASVLELRVERAVLDDLRKIDDVAARGPADPPLFVAAASDRGIEETKEALGGPSITSFSMGRPGSMHLGVAPGTQGLIEPTSDWMEANLD